MIYSKKQARDLGFNPIVIVNKKELIEKAKYLPLLDKILLIFK